MKALCYKNTLSNLPSTWKDPNLHVRQNLGFAYELDTHYVHIYGYNKGFKGLSTGLTYFEGKSSSASTSLLDWVQVNFGATDITESIYDVGESIKGVWRPGIYYDNRVAQAIGFSEDERHLSEQSVRVLIDKLDEIFFYVEPHESTKHVFSHKIRELLILSCTEVENFWTSFLSGSNISSSTNRYTTNDYVKLKDNLFLSDFEFSLVSYPALGGIRPFENWNRANPTLSLFWYDAYNKTKHDRKNYFNQATLWNAINAIVGCMILHIIRFGPYALFEGTNQFSSVVQQHFNGKFSADIDCQKSFYIPKIVIPTENFKSDKMIISSGDYIQDYIVNDFVIL